MAGTTKAPAEHQNVQRWAGGKGAADEASAKLVICRVVGLFAESTLAEIRSSLGFAAIHTASEQHQCFQIPDSLDGWGVDKELMLQLQ